MLVGSSNAVNITDGLDGLAAGLCTISFISYGIIAFNSPFILGYEEIGIFCFILVGALIGFLFFIRIKSSYMEKPNKWKMR